MRRRLASGLRFEAMALAGVVVALIVGFAVAWDLAPIAGWAAACVSYTGRVWVIVQGMDAEATRAHSTRENPARPVADLLVLGASVASLAAVAVVLVQAESQHGAERAILAAFAVASVALSWLMVHTLYLLRYARLYYRSPEGGIDFNQEAPPCYSDFAYLAFTLGMTFQVSDTNIGDTTIRRTILSHTLLSYVFGTVILATLVNLVAGLA